VDVVDANKSTDKVVEEDHHCRCDGAPLHPWASKQDARQHPIVLPPRRWRVDAEGQELHIGRTTSA
jgi:hypothetical protein